MEAVILAAGIGRRLALARDRLPKCLIKMGNETLLARMVNSLSRFNVAPVNVVVGFMEEAIRAEAASTLRGSDVRFVYNEEFTRGSILSLWSARDLLGRDLLLMDADVLFHEEILKRLVETRHENCFLLDRRYASDGEAMVAAGRRNRVVGFGRGFSLPGCILGESVGFFKISGDTGHALKQSIKAIIERGELDADYETAIADLLDAHFFGYEDITGIPWTEIDFDEDLEWARNEVLPKLNSGVPAREFTLLNPGPANTTATVRHAALHLPDLCHREDEFFEVMQEVRAGLLEVAGAPASTHSCVVFTGSGTAAVEATIASVVPDHGNLLVINNGVYGERMARMADAHGIETKVLNYEWTCAARASDVAAALEEDEAITHVAVVHHETTTGLLNPVGEIGRVSAERGRCVIVDAMSSFGGEPLKVAEDQLDFVVSSSNKCLQGLPGLSFVIARRSRLEALADRNPRSVYLDLYNQWRQEEANNTPFTPAVQAFFSLRQAMAELFAEGLDERLKRYAACAHALRSEMGRLGFRILVPEEFRSHLLTAFLLPDGVAYDELHDAMKRRGYIIYAGQGDLKSYAFRLANMGTLVPDEMIDIVLSVEDSLDELGIDKVRYSQ